MGGLCEDIAGLNRVFVCLLAPQVYAQDVNLGVEPVGYPSFGIGCKQNVIEILMTHSLQELESQGYFIVFIRIFYCIHWVK